MKERSISELLKQYYDAFNRGDAAGMLTLVSDGLRHEPSQGTARQGKEAFAAFLDHMKRCYKERAIDPIIMTTPSGDRAGAEFMLAGCYLATDDGLPVASGQDYRLRVGAFFEFEDGLISRISNHYNLADWLQQIGGVGKCHSIESSDAI